MTLKIVELESDFTQKYRCIYNSVNLIQIHFQTIPPPSPSSQILQLESDLTQLEVDREKPPTLIKLYAHYFVH